MTNRLALFGAGGRMGQAIAALLPNGDFELGAELHHAGSDFSALTGCAVAVDFTTPEASVAHARLAARRGLPMVIGTTGLDERQNATIKACAAMIPIVYAANMSIGITLLAALVEQAAAKLGPDYDIEILEMHHRRKADAPSGTALLLAEAARQGRGKAALAATDRNGQRQPGEIGFASLRGGDVAGDHTVYFAGEGERLELTHRAASRTVFAQGALRAAAWVVGRPPGLYGMRDVLDLGSTAP